MLLTTCLLFAAMRNIWKWPLAVCLAVAGLFIVVDAGFFLANLLKIADGGWLPLVLGAAVFLLMMTWRNGMDAVRASLASRTPVTDSFLAAVRAAPRVPGTAVFLSRQDHGAPAIIVEHVEAMGALQKNVLIVTVLFEATPRLADSDRCQVEFLGEGIWRATIRFGFVEVPHLKAALSRVKGLPGDIDLDEAVYFGNRDVVTRRPSPPRLPAWQLPLFAFLYRNAVKAVDRFNLPSERVLEIARQIEI
jgi:KUP system potassium uptake protein